MAQGVPKGMTFVSTTDSTLSVDYLSMYAHMWVICKEIAKKEHLLIHKKNTTMRSVLAVFFITTIVISIIYWYTIQKMPVLVWDCSVISAN